MAVGDIGGIGLRAGGMGGIGGVGGVAFTAPAAAATAAPAGAGADTAASSPASPFASAAQINTLVQGLNNLAASSSLFQPFAGQLAQLNTMVANIDVNIPLAHQPLADNIALLLLALLDEMNKQRNDQGNGGSPLVDLIVAQAMLQPAGAFVNTTA